MGSRGICSWDDVKQAINLAKHGYDFADIVDIFDGRFMVSREDRRFDYGELRFNILAQFEDKIVNVTCTPRGDRMHLISVRPANRDERSVYYDRLREA